MRKYANPWVTCGDLCMGRFTTTQGSAIYLNYEAGRASFNRRYQKLVKSRHRTPENLIVAELPAVGLADPAFLRGLEELMRRHAPVLVVIDTYRAALPGVDENDSRAREYIDPLRRIGQKYQTTFLILAHTRKSSASRRLSQEDVRGSGALVEAADVTFLLSKGKDWDSPSRLIHTKMRDMPRLEDHYIATVDSADGGVSVVATPKAGVQEGQADQKSAELRRDIIAFIEKSPNCRKGGLRKGITGSSDRIDAAVAELLEEGAIIDKGDGNGSKYNLVNERASND